MSKQAFPASFAVLEPWSGWALPTEAERSARRQASTMEDIRAFYTVMLEHLDAALEEVDRHPLEDLPPAQYRLLNLCLALAEVAPAVEQFGQPAVIEAFDVQRFVPERRG